MHHPSLKSWYESKRYTLPSEWEPLSSIPNVLAYDPDVNVFPPLVKNALVNRMGGEAAASRSLRRNTDSPNYDLPKYFTEEGVSDFESGDPFTGAKKLSDFKNLNQLGCCIVSPHNRWHVIIGGAMASTLTAIADPIFYWGVHWHIDQVYMSYLKIKSTQPKIHAFDHESLSSPLISKALNDEQLVLIENAIADSEKLHSGL